MEEHEWTRILTNMENRRPACFEVSEANRAPRVPTTPAPSAVKRDVRIDEHELSYQASFPTSFTKPPPAYACRFVSLRGYPGTTLLHFFPTR